MKRFIIIASLPALSVLAQGAMALPGIDFSAGPYIGLYEPSLQTLNDQVLVWDHHPKLGSAANYGVACKAGFPMGLGGGIGFGYWSNSSSWTDDNSTPGNSDIVADKIAVSAPMLDLTVDYSLPLVPMLLKARVGAAMTLAWGKLKYTSDYTHVTGGQQVTDHIAQTATGNGTAFGLLAGLDLVVIPKVTIGLEAGYRSGKIDKLTVKESSAPGEINTVYQYITTTRPIRCSPCRSNYQARTSSCPRGIISDP